MWDKTVLKAGILGITGGPVYPLTVADAATAWAAVLEDYAKDGTANLVPMISPGPAPMVAPLTAAFGTGAPPAAAAGIIGALDLWVALAVFGGPFVPPPAPTGSPAAIAALQGILGVLGTDADSKADQIATAIDTYAKLVMVTFMVGGVPVVFPLT